VSPGFQFGNSKIGPEEPPFFIAEISANHGGNLDDALRLVEIAAACGAKAVKIQHYTAETITVRSDLPEFRVGGGTIWDGRQLADLYDEAMTPWEWTKPIMEKAAENGIEFFSSPFDETAVDFLEEHNVVGYKIASFELIDLPLIRYVASTRKPIIMSTGMATKNEIDAAVDAARNAGAEDIALLRCNSGYPAKPEEMDLAAIPEMMSRWGCVVGLSDHTLSPAAAVAAVGLGATIFEKHIIESRDNGGPDSLFSLEPDELKYQIQLINEAWTSIGQVRLGPSSREMSSLAFRPSLRAVQDIASGQIITENDVKSVRPAGGMMPDEIVNVIGRTSKILIAKGTAITEDLLGK
jgi:N-acetylneuraminate synthase